MRLKTGPAKLFRWGIAGVLAVAIFGGGWTVACQFQSPAQREATARPPTAGPLFVPATEGVLSEQVSGSGSITYERLDTITAGQGGIVTSRPLATGHTVRAGGVVTEIESQPVFVFPGGFPFYRNLTAGAHGADVAQLQDGLRAAGHPIPRSEDGTFGAATVSAVKALYSTAGYPAPHGFPLVDLSVAGSLPATVYRVPAVGSRLEAGATIATLAHGRLVARISLDAGAFAGVRKGQQAAVTGDTLATALAGRVTGLTSGSSHSDPQVTVDLTAPASRRLAGASIVVTITVKAVAHRGLIVPTRAIGADAAQAPHVIVKSGAERHSMAIRVLGSLDGRSVVEPITAASTAVLKPGTLVQVG